MIADVFETPADGDTFARNNTVAIIKTTAESAALRKIGNSYDGTGTVGVTWVLVDVDGDGDFNATTDMAIALLGEEGDLVPTDFT